MGWWGSANVTVPIAPQLDGSMELHLRFSDAADGMEQLLLRPSLNYRLDDGFAVAAGYSYVRTNGPRGLLSEEHRSWQQASASLVNKTQLRLTSRTRIEQRFVDQRPGTGWRLRQQLRLNVPLGKTSGVEALIWNESFVGLNQTVWGQRRDLDRIRTFVGATVPLSAKVRLEPGYLNQAVFRRGRDRMDHVLAANLSVRL